MTSPTLTVSLMEEILGQLYSGNFDYEGTLADLRRKNNAFVDLMQNLAYKYNLNRVEQFKEKAEALTKDTDVDPVTKANELLIENIFVDMLALVLMVDTDLSLRATIVDKLTISFKELLDSYFAHKKEADRVAQETVELLKKVRKNGLKLQQDEYLWLIRRSKTHTNFLESVFEKSLQLASALSLITQELEDKEKAEWIRKIQEARPTEKQEWPEKEESLE